MPAAIILAAGLGTRMRSRLPKALHPLAGRPMLAHLIAAAEEVFERIVVVVGPDMAALEEAAAPYPVVVQEERLGTGHAALQGADLLEGIEGDAAVLYADNPLVSPATMRRLTEAREASGAGLALLAMRPADPGRYGRMIPHADGGVARVAEWRDASEAERAEGLCNAGLVCAPVSALLPWLRRLGRDNAAGEYYLTDVVALARADGARCVAVEAPEAECRGVNTRAELALAEACVQDALRLRAMEGGATLVRPGSVTFAHDTRLGMDVVVEPDVVFGPGVAVEDGVAIRAFSHLEGCVVRSGAVVGPFARLRPGAAVERGAHVGNFVEIKNAVLGEGAKINHLAYLGDARVGAGANIGAGAITCNYDGRAKHRTEIGAGAFVGTNAALVAPVRVGARAVVAAGSVITADVPDDALAIGRGAQVNKAGRGTASRRKGS